ncbi:MAG: hypothetical protein ABIS50_22305 [Luteolibacter sp.]|uniref:hypothetical protein n=1 Tax=Luteolibacter sp. TaxID=1962973 RepID=UPI003265AA8E
METIHGEPSYHLGTPEMDLYITARGGQMSPVFFHLTGRDISPYSLAPWVPAEYPEIPPLLSVLRGDFLCFPFGGQTNGPPHGETANCEWTRVDSDSRSLRFRMETEDTGATVVKTIATREGQHAIYFEYEISGADGDFSYGNHPIIDFSGLAERAGRVTTSAFHWASVFPGQFSDPSAGETQALAEGAVFTDLREVKLAAEGTTDLTRYPDRAGNEDLVMMAYGPATDEQPFAWSAALLDRYVWFSLKNPADFPGTILWISNAGRTAPPWNGRHVGRMGIEDVCSHFSDGVDKSRLDLLGKQGVATTRKFRKDQPVTLRSIHAVAAVPDGFGAVIKIVPQGGKAVAVTGESGVEIIVPLEWGFVA